MKLATGLLISYGVLLAQAPQAPNPTQRSVEQVSGGTPIYRVTVVARTTKAINYHHRSGSTQIGFRGTALMPDARGEAKVESKQGVIKIEAEMEKISSPSQYGPEYLTYVMWAVTPEGRATNVGEVVLNGNDTKSKLNATSELQTFGLIVTAEPYFAVTQPSDVVVMENFVRRDTTGTIEEIDAKYELLARGQYTMLAPRSEIQQLRMNSKTPLELHEARNAVQIARWTGAERYAPDTFHKAVIGLQNAEGYLIGKKGSKTIGTVAREAVQMAEDARIITVKRIAEEQLANERQSAATRELTARAEAQTEAQRRLMAENAQHAEAAQRARADSERIAAQSEADRIRREADNARVAASAEIERARIETANAENARAAAIEQQQIARAETERARLSAEESDRQRQKAESEKAELRAQLLRQFNLVLQTRDTARGLIVNMSDVLFDTDQFTLRPGAREKLAKVSGIILGHPGLRLDVEGHTDSVGAEHYNQQLSENRADAVRDFLVRQGIQSSSVSVKGFGKTQPVVSNDTPAGRQQNRRVELVVSGEIIGTAISAVVVP